MPHPYDSIPELAGIATYKSAARVGYSVAENVRRLLSYHWTERRLMHTLVAHIPSMPIWEVKCAMALHQWQCAEHVDALRGRIAEMRNPAPNLDTAPDDVTNYTNRSPYPTLHLLREASVEEPARIT